MTTHHDQSASTDGGVRWGVRCADDEVLWVDGRAAALRLLASLHGAQHLVLESGSDDGA